MSRKVVLSKTAERKLEKLFDYLIENWSLKVKSDFVKKLDHDLEIIKIHPKSFLESLKERGLHKCVVTKHTTLYFRLISTQISIVTVFDNRQNPKKLNKDL